eukprot:CAMPEP_0181097324 /NCGR_PEP_ID=MMETSP1071-20121207/11505_1 /TAXON_ID=35127 /ORGANISM="Thalassiosira sp., Strain NH16" /LENGTH=584 /DNA_ID=CAMNT_0023179791 /DNA_START=17 /DNA_END=1771 /DNA_ORIENTATION=+
MTKSGNTAFVKSVDSLFGQEIVSVDSPWFSDGPPLVLGAKTDKRSLKLLKQKCRWGLPPQLRCAVWISSVMRTVNPHLPISETDSYGTVGAENSIDAKWGFALNAVFTNPTDRDDAIAPDLGLGQEMLHQLIENDYREWGVQSGLASDSGAIPEEGVRSLTLVLCTAHQVLGIEFCPPLPDVAAILLTHMPESYAFTSIREMINDTSNFLPVSQRDYYSWCKTYALFVKRMVPHTYKVMESCGALDPQGLDPIFKRFFTTILKREDVLRFMDVYMLEGCKAIFRLALSLLKLIVKKELKSLLLTDAQSWWNEIRYRTLDPSFSFQKHLDKMYPKYGNMGKRYPRRHIIGRANKFHEKWARDNMPVYIDQTPPKPISYTSEKCLLAKRASVRSYLAKWLPPSLRATKLDLVYSTEIHGRSLASLYKECRRSKNTIVLVEAMTGNTSSTIGMFASCAWNINPSPYGDGECFLFRANPNPMCFNWMPDCSGDMDALESQAAREQFMVARNDFIAMGANTDGTNGLRLDQELVKGESYPALGFDNEPLPGRNCNTFDVGVLEVYHLIREVDGKVIGHNKNPVWDLEGL